MKAAVLYGREDVRVEEIQARGLNPGEVHIRIEAALTCGTDFDLSAWTPECRVRQG